MKIMDHDEAVRLQAAEKYLLGELPKELHAAYEEHYFDCPACAEEIKTTLAFMESARQVVRQEALETAGAKGLVPASPMSGRWFGWLRPAFAVPVFAALLLFIGYQNGVTIPRLKDSSASQVAAITGAPLHLSGSVRGGSDTAGAENKLRVRAGESFLLDFDFTPSHVFGAYKWQLLGESGRAVRHGVFGGDKSNQTVYLPVVGGVERPGKYNLVFYGGADGNGQTANENEVQRLTFTVEFAD